MRAAGVSVVIPTYRATEHIAAALDSVFAQTLVADEVIVVNDGCPDTIALEHALQPYRDRIVYLRRENGGPGAARNTGIRAATAPLVAFLDADDLWEPEFLREQVGFLTRRPDADLVYCDGAVVAHGGQREPRTLMESSPSIGEPTLEALLAQRCTVLTSSVVVRRERLLAAGLFDESIGNYSEDFDLYLRLARSGARLAYQEKVLLRHRNHDGSLTAVPRKLSAGLLRVLDKTRGYQDLRPAERTALEHTAARITAQLAVEDGKDALLRGDYATARERFLSANTQLRSRKLRLVLLALRLAPGLLRHLQARRTEKLAPSTA
jgi:GT2 family glycosyltransferase